MHPYFLRNGRGIMDTSQKPSIYTLSESSFVKRFTALRESRGPFCLGLDPTPQLLQAWGLQDDAHGLRKFCDRALQASGEQLAVIKPQSAYFERFGSEGIEVLQDVVDSIHRQGSLALLDVKRGDIGSTNQAYAQAYLGTASAFKADAITVHAYLGFQALWPMMEHALSVDASLFVVALSSNPEGKTIQQAQMTEGSTVAQGLCDEITSYNRTRCTDPVGPIGAVVGVTAEGIEETVNRLKRSLILAPGLGVQGGRFATIRSQFAAANERVLPVSSRSVLSKGPDIKLLQEAIKFHGDQAMMALKI